MEENKVYCSCCGTAIDDDDYEELNGQIICDNCAVDSTCICNCCGSRIWNEDSYGDEYTNLCSHCYNNHYTRCSNCDCLIYEDDAYNLDGYSYCRECYDEERDKCHYIHEYGYKPELIFYGDSDRYFGVELEIDGAGKDDNYAEELLEIANMSDEHIYIKSDGSLDDGMEIVSHPMTLKFHKDFCWEEIMRKAISLGYRSHQTTTCGLHIHVNRDCLGEDRDDQEMVISKVLYFTEHHWNELLKFSRRSEYAMNRWAARYGYEYSSKAILEKAKKGGKGRYTSVNLCNYATIEFRKSRNLPETKIETDSYVAVQLLESKDKLNFDSLRYMAETVEGNFTFSVLDDDNSLYFVKGSNPLCLLHFESLGLYIYASTESIMKNVLKRVGLHKFAFEKIEVIEGDILRIDKDGKIIRSEFESKLYRSKYMNWYGDDEPYYGVHEELLLAYCGCYGVDSSDVELLLEYGYTCDEIEDMLADHTLLQETLQVIKFEDGESLYKQVYGGIH